MRTIRNQYWNFGFVSYNFFSKTQKCSCFNNFGQMWLVNELVENTFSTSIKYAKSQFNPIILSKVINYTTYRQTDTFVKTVFSDSGGLKT